MQIGFPDRSVGRLRGWNWPEISPIDLGEAQGSIDTSCNRLGLDIDPDCRDIGFLASIENIAKIEIQRVDFPRGQLELIGALPKLEHLSLSTPAMDDRHLLAVGPMPNLLALTMINTSITPAGLLSLGRPRLMSFVYSSVDAIGLGDETVSEVANWSDRLRYLLTSSSSLSGALIHLGLPPSIEQLCLVGSRIAPEDMNALTSLQTLEILHLKDHSSIDDRVIEALPVLPRMQSIGLRGTSVTPRCLPTLAKQPSLRRAELTNTGISEELAAQFGMRLSRRLRNLRPVGGRVTPGPEVSDP